MRSSVLELFVDVVPFAKDNPIFINPVVKELTVLSVDEESLAIKALFKWLSQSGPTETSWERDTEEQSCLPWESP